MVPALAVFGAVLVAGSLAVVARLRPGRAHPDRPPAATARRVYVITDLPVAQPGARASERGQ